MRHNMFTDGVKWVMQQAREESIRQQTNYIGTEHLLLGVVHYGRGRAIDVLTGAGVELQELVAQLEEQLARAAGKQHSTDVPFTPRAKQILEMAANESRERQDRFVDVEHVLLALLKNPENVAQQALAAYDLDYEKAAAALGDSDGAGAVEEQTIGVSLPADLLQRIDQQRGDEYSRAGFIAQLVAQYFAR